MSAFPDNIRDFKAYVVSKRPGTKVSVRGFVGPKRDDGYHLGRTDIVDEGRGIWDKETNPDGDYSTRRQRDRDGLTEFASAFDLTFMKPNPDGKMVPNRVEMAKLTAWMYTQGKAGKLDLWEFGGPAADGFAYWWWQDRRGRWRVMRLTGQAARSHLTHIHGSIPRDRVPDDDLIAEFEPFFGPRPVPLPPDDGEDPEPDEPTVDPRIAELEEENERLKAELDISDTKRHALIDEIDGFIPSLVAAVNRAR